MATTPKIMLIGLGDLGSVLLELLVREPGIGQVVVASRNAERGLARCNLACLGALAQGCSPQVRFTPLDLDDQPATVDIIRREAPDLILSTATRQTWWLPALLPPAQAGRLQQAGFGIWLPVNLALTYKLMAAVRAADYQGPTLTAPFPDVVNPVLDRLGLAPTCGIGNVDEIVPKVRLLVAERLNVAVAAVQVWLVAHHALGAAAFGDTGATEMPPYFLRVEVGGQDATESVQAAELLRAAYPVTQGRATHFLTAGSTIRLIRALLAGRDTLLHAPAPNGLPGGYPVLAGRRQVRPAIIPGLSLAEAVAINERSHRFDGIERIEADGTVVFCPDSAAIVRDMLGYDCDRLSPAEVEFRASELIARFREFARFHGVNLDLAGNV